MYRKLISGHNSSHVLPTKVEVSGYRILDPKFCDDPRPYVLQCLAVTAVIFVVLTALDALTQTVLVASLGASAFIAFAMPHVKSARPRYLVGGVTIGTLAGCGGSLLYSVLAPSVAVQTGPWLIAFGAMATGVAIFVMVITDTEHPPAAALALGFALNDWNGLTVVVVLGGIIAISSIKEVCKSHMIDLL